MLYLSTRSKTESFTAYRTLHSDTAPDGGMFVPYRLPRYDSTAISQLHENSFGQVIAEILNHFFAADLTGWDVECCVGRAPVRIADKHYRLMIAECWHNPANQYAYLENSLYARLTGASVPAKPSKWASIAIRIAVLFGVYTRLSQTNTFDVAVPAGDFTLPMAVWYARKMGLPVGTILCCSSEDSRIWDLISRGEYSTGTSAAEPPYGLEMLFYSALGIDAALWYQAVCQKHGTVRLDEETLRVFNAGFACSVVGDERVPSTIGSIYRSTHYVAGPDIAVAFGGLQDYRARTGENKYTLLLSDRSPILDADIVHSATGIEREQLMQRIHSLKE